MKNLLCSTCKVGDKLITDFESGKIVFRACGTVFPGQIQNTRRELTVIPANGLYSIWNGSTVIISNT